MTTRIARCTCGKTETSHSELPMFQFRGEGSRAATETCGECNYHPIAHERAKDPTQLHLKHIRGHEFSPAGSFDFDLFYCGCRGWD